MPAKETPVPAESAPAKPGSDAAKEAESGTAKKRSDPDKNWKELRAKADAAEAKAAALEARLAKLEEPKGAKPAAEIVKPTAEIVKPPEPPKRPRMAEFLNNGTLDSEKYEAAMDKYEKDREDLRETESRARNAVIEQGRIIDKWKTDLKGKYSDKADGIDVKATVDKLVTTLKDAPAFAAFVNDSEVFTDLLYVLGTDPELDKFIELAKTNPTKAIRKLVALEAGVQAELAKGKTGKVDEPAEKHEKKITSAGKPPSEVGGTTSTAGDEAEAALKRGDSEAYRRIMNERDRAKFKARRGR
jgi:hypothetical protein